MKKNNKGYSIIIIIIIIGFLLALTGAIYKLVLVELNDNRGRYSYLKANYASKGAGELAMLMIKEKGYGYDQEIIFDKNNPISNILNFENNKNNPLISYNINSKISNYTGSIGSLGYDIIPLFYIDDSGSGQILDLELSVNDGNEDKLSWNLISKNSGLSGIGNFSGDSSGIIKELGQEDYDFIIGEKTLKNFLNENKLNYNYLILFNSDSEKSIIYNLDGKNKFFSKPRTEIYAGAKISGYKQSISIKYNNTEYLGLLKYSIFDK